MLKWIEQDAYLEALEQRHTARLIVTEEIVVKKPVNRGSMKYLACRTLLKKAYRSHR